jgi:hypothetical protein
MRIVSALIVTVAFFGTPQVDSSWITFSPPHGTFVVSMPTQPRVSSHELAAPSGAVTTLVASAEQTNGDQFTVSVTSYCPTAKKPVASAESLTKMENVLLESKNGTHLERLHGNHQSDATFKSGDGRMVRVRFDIEGGRVYQLMAEVSGDARENADVSRFFNSFRLRGDKES